MSDTAKNETTQEAGPMDALFARVYLPVFMQKMAELGSPIENEADLQQALRIAMLLRMQEGPQTAEKSAALKMAAYRLEAATLPGQEADASVDQFMADPEVQKALGVAPVKDEQPAS